MMLLDKLCDVKHIMVIAVSDPPGCLPNVFLPLLLSNRITISYYLGINRIGYKATIAGQILRWVQILWSVAMHPVIKCDFSASFAVMWVHMIKF